MKKNIINNKINNIEEYLPNTDNYRIRLDANESPVMLDHKILNEFIYTLSSAEFNRYPDPFAMELINEYSNIYNIDPRNVVAGNGSDELISLICNGFIEAGDNAIVTLPDFSMYEFYFKFSGVEVIQYNKNDNYDIDFNNLANIVNETMSKIVIFSNPCNPTGNIFKRSEIEIFIKNVDALVVVDEAYMDFSDDNQSLLDIVNEYENLIVLKTLSKAYASAAMRIGFAVANENIIKAMKKIKSPYNLNSISQLYGKILLKNQSEAKKNIKYIKSNTRYLYDKLKIIETSSNIVVYPTAANFVYIKLSSPEEAKRITDNLKTNGIAIRCMAPSGCIRITAGQIDEIDETIDKFTEALL